MDDRCLVNRKPFETRLGAAGFFFIDEASGLGHINFKIKVHSEINLVRCFYPIGKKLLVSGRRKVNLVEDLRCQNPTIND